MNDKEGREKSYCFLTSLPSFGESGGEVAGKLVELREICGENKGLKQGRRQDFPSGEEHVFLCALRSRLVRKMNVEGSNFGDGSL